MRDAFARHDGYEVDHEGDAFFFAFASAPAAVDAVAEAMQALADRADPEEERWLEPLRDKYRTDFELGTTLGLDETIELALQVRTLERLPSR